MCWICGIEKNAHSLQVLEQLDGVDYLYTCPAKAVRYDDREGILSHYRGVLEELKGKWIWIFDATGFGAKHYLQLRLARDLARLVDEYGDELLEIRIYGANRFLNLTYSGLKEFMSERIREKVVWL